MMETTTNGAVGTIEFAGVTYKTPYVDLLPQLTDEDYQELKEDIRANGVMYPVVIDDDNNVIDGHHRLRIAAELGIPYSDVRKKQVEGLPEEKRRELAYNLNLHRRQLTQQQKRKLIAKLLKTDPEKSDRAIAEQAGVTNKTAANVRKELEASEEIPHTPERTDKSGRKQKAKKPAKTKPEADAETGGERFNQWLNLKSYGLALETKGRETIKLAKTPVKDRNRDQLHELTKGIRLLVDAIERIELPAA
jgi:ParB-like chromosome segregation protein Spo0J